MKNPLFFLVLVLLLQGHSSVAQASGSDRPPNIIVFMVDDMGWMDTSEPFYDSLMPLNERYHTPNMSRLAEEGVKFTNAYAQPVCTPTRVSYITGMNAVRTKVTNWTSPYRDRSTDAPDEQLAPPEWNRNGWSYDPGTEQTVQAAPFPALLKAAGYFTIHVGKAHWGSMGTPGSNPYNVGFMVNIAGHAGGHPQSYLSEDQYGNLPGKSQPQAVPDLEEYYQTGTFLTEALTLEALKALKNPVERGEPFFLNLSQYALHTPIMADDRFVQKYYEAGLDSIEARYAGLIEGMDKSLGDVMDFLEQHKLAENTVLLFITDNGGLDHHQRGGAVNTHNFPLRSGKGSVYEGGVRVPMMVRWPGVSRANTVIAEPVIIEDFFPTILEIAGVTAGDIPQETDGRSFVPLLKNPDSEWAERPLIFHYPHKWVKVEESDRLGINYYTAMRYGKWKLVYSMLSRDFELFDLSADIGEDHDLSSEYPEKLRELTDILNKTLKARDAQMPMEKRTGKPLALPGEDL